MTSLRFDSSHRSPHSAHARGPAARENSMGSGVWGIPGMLSIVIPAKNEAGNLPSLVSETASAFRPLTTARSGGPALSSFEILVVDDGSTDETSAVLNRLAMGFPELRGIRLERNVGQSAATAAGFREARGEWVGMLDADLQNPPSELARLWEHLAEADVVLGWRMKREDNWRRRLVSRHANRIRNAVLGQSIRDTGCSVRLFSREAALRLPMFNGFHRFIGPLLAREGYSIKQVPVEHRKRSRGVSHYNFWNRSLRVVVDLFGVAWLMRRGVRYEIAGRGSPGEPASRVPAHHLARSQQEIVDRQEAA